MRLFLIIYLLISVSIARAQDSMGKSGNMTKYVGKYEENGTIVQVTSVSKRLVLVVPGAPVQELKTEELKL